MHAYIAWGAFALQPSMACKLIIIQVYTDKIVACSYNVVIICYCYIQSLERKAERGV